MAAVKVIEVTCLYCCTNHTILVPVAGYKLWSSGQALIQDALPSLTDDERELLKTHICPNCWEKMFE